MSAESVKPKDSDSFIVEEESGVIQRTIQKVSSAQRENRKRTAETFDEPSNKYRHSTDGSRVAASSSTSRIDSERGEKVLRVPFWKQLNRRQTSNEFRTRSIGSFSILHRTNDKECYEDQRYMRIYKYPLKETEVNFDLKVGETEQAKNDEDKNIDPMLWWISRHKTDIFKDGRFTFDFLSWRGVLRMIMFSIYEKHSDWMLAVIKFKNAYFLCEYVTEQQIKEEENKTAEHRAFCHYGHKFEEYVTKNATTEEEINPSKQFAGVFQSTFGHHRLVYGAEMDCILESKSTNKEHIELKVCAGKSVEDLPLQFNRKFAKWWIQCFLADIQQMVVGFRDNNGIVSQLSPLSINEIEKTARSWTRESFFNFFNMFAEFLRQNVTEEYSPTRKEVTLFHFVPSMQSISVKKSSDPKYHFLRDWFYEEFQ